jgi:hypothetical protein
MARGVRFGRKSGSNSRPVSALKRSRSAIWAIEKEPRRWQYPITLKSPLKKSAASS